MTPGRGPVSPRREGAAALGAVPHPAAPSRDARPLDRGLFLIAVVGRHLMAPPTLDAEQQLETAMSNSQLLEQRLRDWKPDSRVLDGATAEVVMQLEDEEEIAALDAELARASSASEAERLEKEVALWQQRVGLMNALVEVHVTKASNVDL